MKFVRFYKKIFYWIAGVILFMVLLFWAAELTISAVNRYRYKQQTTIEITQINNQDVDFKLKIRPEHDIISAPCRTYLGRSASDNIVFIKLNVLTRKLTITERQCLGAYSVSMTRYSLTDSAEKKRFIDFMISKFPKND